MSLVEKAFFWGAPSHKPIAWIGAVAGVAVIALAGVVTAKAHPLFSLSVFCIGVAEFGWAAELLPRRLLNIAGWARLVRWLSALIGTLLAVLCLVFGLTPVVWFGAVIAGTGLLLTFEMAPSGPANRPREADRRGQN